MRCWCGGRVEGQTCLDSMYHDPFATGVPSVIEMLYIAGGMTGYPDCNYPAFHMAAEQLREAGYKVISPAEFGGGEGHYVDIIREDLRLLLDCHGVAVLEGWWESVGARNEVQVAGLLKMPVRPVQEWLARTEEND